MTKCEINLEKGRSPHSFQYSQPLPGYIGHLDCYQQHTLEAYTISLPPLVSFIPTSPFLSFAPHVFGQNMSIQIEEPINRQDMAEDFVSTVYGSYWDSRASTG